LNTPGSVTLKFKRCTVKRKHGHRKLTCKRSAGTLALGQGRAGGNKIPFAGQLSRHKKLRVGTYSVTFTATNTSGSTTSKPLEFTIEP
jgi:hypothetical protein